MTLTRGIIILMAVILQRISSDVVMFLMSATQLPALRVVAIFVVMAFQVGCSAAYFSKMPNDVEAAGVSKFGSLLTLSLSQISPGERSKFRGKFKRVETVDSSCFRIALSASTDYEMNVTDGEMSALSRISDRACEILGKLPFRSSPVEVEVRFVMPDISGRFSSWRFGRRAVFYFHAAPISGREYWFANWVSTVFHEGFHLAVSGRGDVAEERAATLFQICSTGVTLGSTTSLYGKLQMDSVTGAHLGVDIFENEIAGKEDSVERCAARIRL